MSSNCVLEILKDANPIHQLSTPMEISSGFGFSSVQKLMEWLDIAKLSDLFRHGKCGYFMPKENMSKFTKRYSTCLKWDDPHLLRRLDREHLLAHAIHKNRLIAESDGSGVLCIVVTVKQYEEFAAKIGQKTNQCPYCLKAMNQREKSVDHIQALSLGGYHRLENLVICCRFCNSKKKGKLYLEWMEELTDEQSQSALNLYLSRFAYPPQFQALNWYIAEDSHDSNFYELQESI